MKKLLLASITRNSGKTALGVGIALNAAGGSAGASRKKIGFFKPIGDRLAYKDKKSWDEDAATFKAALSLADDASDLSVGVGRSKLAYFYDEKALCAKVNDRAAALAKGKDLLLIEAGRDVFYGAGVGLDALSLAECTESEVLFVLSGSDSTVADEIVFLKKYLQPFTEKTKAKIAGVVFNKVQSRETFEENWGKRIREIGVPVLGFVPRDERLEAVTAGAIAENLLGQIVAGGKGLERSVQHVIIGAMSVQIALKSPVFKYKNKLVITGGDRADMIVAAMEHDSSCIILTGGLLPPANVLALADEKNIPLISVKSDTYSIAKRVEALNAAFAVKTRDDAKLKVAHDLVKQNVDLKKLFA